MKALIENIQHFSLHDGPGTRTTVFFKGCPLRCEWCSNPTTQAVGPELLQKKDNCLVCGRCASVCPRRAVRFETEGAPVVDRKACDNCGLCARQCPGKALLMAGREYDLNQVCKILAADILFYRNSGGGVTLSGGEVLMQHDFAAELCKRCGALHIHTAIETSGFAPYERLEALARVTDLVFYDLKHLDGERHKRITGQSNALVLANLERLLAQGRKAVHVRLPLIPGMNDEPEHLEAYGRYLAGLGGELDLEVLPYHRLGKNKYAMLGRPYALGDIPPMPREDVAAAVESIRNNAGGLNVFCVA